jgi:hypothetical protein
VKDKRRAEFQNEMDSKKNMMKIENKCRTKFWDDTYSMKMGMERTSSMPMKQMVHLPAPSSPASR